MSMAWARGCGNRLGKRFGKPVGRSRRRMRRFAVVAAVCGGAIAAPTPAARADNRAIGELKTITILIGSMRRKSANVVSYFPDIDGAVAANEKITDDELARIAAIVQAVEAQHAQASLNGLGQASLNGTPNEVNLLRGTLATLTFDPFNPMTNTTFIDATIASVRYDAILDPILAPSYVLLGTSTNSGNHFALPWTVDGFEPLVRATPLNALGQPIVYPGVDGVNAATGFVADPGSEFDYGYINAHAADYVPEPSCALLIATTATTLTRHRRRMLRA